VLLVPNLVPSFQIDVDEAMRTFISPWKFSVFAGLKLPQSDFYGSRGVEILGSGRLPGLIGEAQEGWGSRGDCQTPILEKAPRDGRASVDSITCLAWRRSSAAR
jgi:hypothetical protein